MISSSLIIAGYAASCTALPIFIQDSLAKKDSQSVSKNLYEFQKNIRNHFFNKEASSKNYYDGLLLRSTLSAAISSIASLGFFKLSLSGPILLQLFHLSFGAGVAIPLIFLSIAITEKVYLDKSFIPKALATHLFETVDENLKILMTINSFINTLMVYCLKRESPIEVKESFMQEIKDNYNKQIQKQIEKEESPELKHDLEKMLVK